MGLFLALAGLGCQKATGKKTQTVHLNIVDEPQTLDPGKARTSASGIITRMLFDGLTRINGHDEVELSLAWTVGASSDLKKYTIRLRQSYWSNGAELKASDFVYAWKRTLSPEFPSDIAFHLYILKNARAIKEGKLPVEALGVTVKEGDPTVLEIELEYPAPYFLSVLAHPAFFPIHEQTDRQNPSWAFREESYVSNGPFRLKEWKHNSYLLLEKNPLYWEAKAVRLENLQLMMVQPETELSMFERGEVDWAGSPLSTLPVDGLGELKNQGLLKTKQALDTYFIRTQTHHPVFSLLPMRKAFALAIDRQQIIEHIMQGNQFPATGLVPTRFGLQTAPYFSDGNAQEALRLFDEGLLAGSWTRESLPEISLTYRAGQRNHLLAQAIQQQWFDVFGIRVKLEAVEGKIYFDRVSKQDYCLAFSDWIADFADAMNFLEVFKYKEGGSNNTFWENAQYCSLLDQAARTLNIFERQQLMQESERILMNEMPIIPIFYATMLYVQKPYLKNVALSSMGVIDFKWAFISEK